MGLPARSLRGSSSGFAGVDLLIGAGGEGDGNPPSLYLVVVSVRSEKVTTPRQFIRERIIVSSR